MDAVVIRLASMPRNKGTQAMNQNVATGDRGYHSIMILHPPRSLPATGHPRDGRFSSVKRRLEYKFFGGGSVKNRFENHKESAKMAPK